MKISYKKLWELLVNYDLTKSQLGDKVEISASTVAKLGRNECVVMDVVVKICNVFHCQISNIVEITCPDSNLEK